MRNFKDLQHHDILFILILTMTFTFKYISDKNELVEFVTNETIHLDDSVDALAFLFLNRLSSGLKLKKKLFLMALKIFADIRFSNHTTSSWCAEGTINQYREPFFSVASNKNLQPRVKYLFRLSEKGVELYNFLESILLVVEDKEANAEEFIKGYITFKELT